MTVKDWWMICIPSIVTIAGLVVTYILANKKIEDELNFYKKSSMVEGLKICIDELSSLFDSIKDGEYTPENHKKLMANIYSYGSKEAIAIAAYWQQSTYNKAPDVYTVFGCIALLISQVKLDITAEKLKPDMLFKLRLSDYTTNDEYRNSFKKKLNEIVNELDLDKSFLV